MEHTHLLTKKFRINLKHLRNANYFSQINVAKELQISTRGYQRIESGDSQPTLDLIFKIANIFNVEVSDLFNYSNKDDSFVEISKAKVKDLVHGQEFLKQTYNLQKDYLNKEITSNESFLDLVARDDKFTSSELPLYVSDLLNVITNRPSAKVLARKPLIKMSIAAKWKEQKASISIINRIYGREEVFFKSTHVYQVDHKNTEVNYCNFYKSFPNGESFLTGLILDTKEL
ncbi:MAG: DNA-binding XRE family transcriptional regulator [Bacteriovoracaceae bacterium]|jgi:DNA-binding XRE family transcriptional regulator